MLDRDRFIREVARILTNQGVESSKVSTQALRDAFSAVDLARLLSGAQFTRLANDIAAELRRREFDEVVPQARKAHGLD